MKNIIILLALLASLFGIALRSVELVNHNYVFVYDQGLDMLASRSIAVDHKLTLIGAEAGGGFAGLPGLFHGPGYHYLLAFVSLFSRGDPYGEMVFLWVTQMLGLWGIYMIGKRFIGFWGACISVFIAAVSPVFIGMTRVIWAPNFSGLGILLYLYVLLSFRHKKILPVALLGVVSSGLYHVEIPFAVVAVLSSCIYLGYIEKSRSVRLWAMFVLGSLVGILPMILFDARHGWITMQGLLGFITHPVAVVKTAPFDIVGHIRVILYSISSIFPPIPSLPYWFWFACLSIGVYVAFLRDMDNHRVRVVKILCIIVCVHVVLFSFYRNPIYGHYLTILSYVCIIISGYVGQTLFESKRTWVVAVFVCVISIPSLLLYPQTIVADYHDYGGTAKIRGKKDAIDFIYADSQTKPFGLLIFTPPVYAYPYDYILKWYALPKYGYLPTQTKTSTFYLLIEPDVDKPWSYTGWLETVIKTGKVINTWKLPSGFIIEKRVESVL